MERMSIANTAAARLVPCIVLTITAIGCGEAEPDQEIPAQIERAVVADAKYATPKEVHDAFFAAAKGDQVDKVVACLAPDRLDGELKLFFFLASHAADQDKLLDDRAKQLTSFLKAHGFEGLGDVKRPKDADAKEFIEELAGRVKDKRAFVIEHHKRKAAHRAEKGRVMGAVPVLEELEIDGDKAEGLSANREGGEYSAQTVRFELIDGSWRISHITMP